MKTCQLVRFLEASAEQYSEAAREDRARFVEDAQHVFGRFMAERELSPKYNDRKQMRVLDKVMAKVSERGLPFADSFEFLTRAVIEPRFNRATRKRRASDEAEGSSARQITPPPFYEPPRSADSMLFQAPSRPTLSSFLGSPRTSSPPPPSALIASPERERRYAIELARPYAFCAAEEMNLLDFGSDVPTYIDPSLLGGRSESSDLTPEELESLVFVEVDRAEGTRHEKPTSLS